MDLSTFVGVTTRPMQRGGRGVIYLHPAISCILSSLSFQAAPVGVLFADDGDEKKIQAGGGILAVVDTIRVDGRLLIEGRHFQSRSRANAIFKASAGDIEALDTVAIREGATVEIRFLWCGEDGYHVRAEGKGEGVPSLGPLYGCSHEYLGGPACTLCGAPRSLGLVEPMKGKQS